MDFRDTLTKNQIRYLTCTHSIDEKDQQSIPDEQNKIIINLYS